MKKQILRALTQLRILTQVGAAISMASLAFALPGDGNLVIKAGKVITVTGETIENGTIVIEGGRITAIGKNVEYPWTAPVKEFPNSVAFPGFVEALTNRGMDRANENIDVAAFLNVRDSIDPVNFYFEDSLRAGVTTINVQQGASCVVGGMGYVVKPKGLTIEEMLVRPDFGNAMAASPKGGKSRATQVQALRKAFTDLRRYLEGIVQEKQDGVDYATREALYQGREPDEETAKGRPMAGQGWKVENLQLVPRWEIDEKQAPLLSIVEGKTTVFFYCATPQDVRTAISVAGDNGFLHRIVLVLGNSCWKAADLIAENKVPVILSSALVHTERDPVTGKETETFVPGVFKDKGIRFALRSAGVSSQSLWYQAALCVGHGMSRQDAIAAVTTTPAEMLGLGKRVGHLSKGADGNVVIFSGDPLSVTSFAEYVVLEGQEAYDRATDTRFRHLQTGEQPENTVPAQEGAEVHAHSEEEPEKEKDKVDAGENEEEKKDDDHDKEN